MSNSGPGRPGPPEPPEPPARSIQVLAATFDDGQWSVDLDVEVEPAEDPTLVRLVVADAEKRLSIGADLPVAVLRRLAERIAEL